MTTTDRAVRLQVMVERYKSTLSRHVSKLITALDRASVEAIPGRDIGSYPSPAVVRMLTMADQKLYVESMSILTDYLNGLHDFAKELMVVECGAWGVKPEQSILIAALAAPIGIEGRDCGKAVPQLVENWWKDARGTVFGNIRRYAYENLRNPDIIERIHGVRRTNFKDGLIDHLRRQSATMNNTVVHHLATNVRNEVLKSSTAKAILFSAMFERSTCARCAALDHATFSVNRGPRSPLHYGCRCIIVPVFNDNDLRVESYYEWLARQPESFVSVAIGPRRARLLLEGGLGPDEFARLQLDKRFEPITLDEFKKIAPSVFSKAGV